MIGQQRESVSFNDIRLVLIVIGNDRMVVVAPFDALMQNAYRLTPMHQIGTSTHLQYIVYELFASGRHSRAGH